MLGSQLLAGRRVVQPRSPPPVRASSFVSVSSLETLPRDISRLPESDELHVVKVTGERAPGHHPPSRTMAKASESLPCKIIWDGDRLEIQLPRNLDLPNSVQAFVKDLSRRATAMTGKSIKASYVHSLLPREAHSEPTYSSKAAWDGHGIGLLYFGILAWPRCALRKQAWPPHAMTQHCCMTR